MMLAHIMPKALLDCANLFSGQDAAPYLAGVGGSRGLQTWKCSILGLTSRARESTRGNHAPWMLLAAIDAMIERCNSISEALP